MPKIVESFEIFVDTSAGRQILSGVLEVYWVFEAGERTTDPALSRWVLASAAINGMPIENLTKLSAEYEEHFLWIAKNLMP